MQVRVRDFHACTYRQFCRKGARGHCTATYDAEVCSTDILKLVQEQSNFRKNKWSSTRKENQ